MLRLLWELTWASIEESKLDHQYYHIIAKHIPAYDSIPQRYPPWSLSTPRQNQSL